MSSVLRHYSQIPVLTKYLIGIANSVVGDDYATSSVISLKENGLFQTIMTANEVNANFGAADPFYVGDMFKDLGRRIMIVDGTGAHVALYREAMPQLDSYTEGIGSIGPVWLRVWDADATRVCVARQG